MFTKRKSSFSIAIQVFYYSFPIIPFKAVKKRREKENSTERRREIRVSFQVVIEIFFLFPNPLFSNLAS